LPQTTRFSARRNNPAVRESSDNIPNGTRRVRVQTVNVNRIAKKCGINLDRRNFYESESAV
jgi:hypothetical protein